MSILQINGLVMLAVWGFITGGIFSKLYEKTWKVILYFILYIIFVYSAHVFYFSKYIFK